MKLCKTVRIMLYILLTLLALVALFFVISIICDYRPKEKETIFTSTIKDPLPDTLSILTWNIGYAGLGDNMDFFYDGGKKVRDSKERTEENLESIIREIKKIGADIILLQEVDEYSHRTYRINQVERLKKEFPEYKIYFAPSFKVWFVPIPIKEPIGKVESGLLILSKYTPQEVIRHQYPSKFPFPVSMFNLKRCLLTAKFTTSQGKEIIIGNTHNSAYDDGGMRSSEMGSLQNLVEENSSKNIKTIIGGDWNQFPPEYTPSEAETTNPHFRPHKIDGTMFDKFGKFSFSTGYTARYNNTSYHPESIKTLIDLFFLSKGIDVLSIETINLEFKNSDHNPVLLKVQTN